MGEALNERLFRVQESHDRAVQTMLRLVEHVGPEGMVTNRHPGSDEQHVEISQRTAGQIADLLCAVKAWREEAWKW